MNIIRSITALVFAIALVAIPGFAEDKPAPCCAKAKEAGKECTHECCVKASKDKTVCEKCGGKKEEKKSS